MQYHFEGIYGITVIFLADRRTAQFWISGNTHARSLDLQQQIGEKLSALTASPLVEVAWEEGA